MLRSWCKVKGERNNPSAFYTWYEARLSPRWHQRSVHLGRTQKYEGEKVMSWTYVLATNNLQTYHDSTSITQINQWNEIKSVCNCQNVVIHAHGRQSANAVRLKRESWQSGSGDQSQAVTGRHVKVLFAPFTTSAISMSILLSWKVSFWIVPACGWCYNNHSHFPRPSFFCHVSPDLGWIAKQVRASWTRRKTPTWMHQIGTLKDLYWAWSGWHAPKWGINTWKRNMCHNDKQKTRNAPRLLPAFLLFYSTSKIKKIRARIRDRTIPHILRSNQFALLCRPLGRMGGISHQRSLHGLMSQWAI